MNKIIDRFNQESLQESAEEEEYEGLDDDCEQYEDEDRVADGEEDIHFGGHNDCEDEDEESFDDDL